MTCKEQAPSNIQTRALWKTWKLIATEGTSDPQAEKSNKNVDAWYQMKVFL